MPVGVSFRTTLTGSWTELDRPGDERPMTLVLLVETKTVTRLALDPVAETRGEIDAEGLATHRAIRGTLSVAPLGAKLTYDLRFPTESGRERRIFATSDVDPLHPLRSLATVVGSLFEEDREVGRVVLRVGKVGAPVHSLVSLLRTVRPR